MDNTFARSVIAVCGAALSLAGCATASKDISAIYVSPNQYASYDCDQLAAEAARIQARVIQLGGRLDQAAQNDAGIMAVGLIIFWPALFALGGTKQQEAEYARLKGEFDAVEQASIAKKCMRGAPSTQTAGVPGTVATPIPAAPTVITKDTVPPTTAAPPAAPGNDAAQPAANATGSRGTASGSTAPGTSKYMFNAERFAKDNGCGYPVATMNIASSNYETFTVACTKGDPISIRCDFGACRELK